MGPACSDETRFQGIATIHLRQYNPKDSFFPLAVTRPVFRGLRLVFPLTKTNTCLPLLTCSDETRFQGIATRRGRGFAPAGGFESRLQ